MSRPRHSCLAASASVAITLILGWVVVSAVVWRHTADADAPPPRPELRVPVEVEVPRVPDPRQALQAPVVLPPPPDLKPAPAATPAPAPEPTAPPEPEPAVSGPAVSEPAASEPVPAPPAQVAAVPRPEVPESRPSARPDVTPDRGMVREGRTLLKLLERGEGPDIEIAWPDDARERTRLYDVFASCFGMRSVVVAADGGLYTEDSAPGRSWVPEPDRVSGYARQPRGALPLAEQAHVNTIRTRHSLSGGKVIRVFPREVDAQLLGALAAVATDDYRAGRSFHAVYELAPNGVRVAGIRVDGRDVGQPVLLGGMC